MAPDEKFGNRNSEAPTASVYSQPSPGRDSNVHGNRVTITSRYSDDVSPPVSPIEEPMQSYNKRSSFRDVSPVDDTYSGFDHKPYPPQQRSHLPRPVAQAPQNDKTPRREPSNRITRWDDFTGELTDSNKGKAGQVKPGSSFSTRQPGQNGYRTDRGPFPSNESNNKRLSLAERAARFGGKGLSIETKPRPEWKGASGRATLVQPVQDKPAQQPFKIPRKTMNRTLSPVLSDDSGGSTPVSTTLRKESIKADTQNVSTSHTTPEIEDEPEIKPIVPLKAGNNSPRGSLGSPASTSQPMHPYPSPVTPGSKHETPISISNVGVGSSPEPNHNIQGDDSPKYQPRPSVDTVTSSRKSKDEPGAVSRFSWTTYATNTTYQHSPPPTPPPPVPAITDSSPVVQQAAAFHPRKSSLDTRTFGSPMARKPVPRSSSPADSQRTRLSVATTGTSKALPRPPPEVESSDHVTILQAQMDDLMIRRNNVQRLIRDLYKFEPQNPMLSDIKSRKETQRKIKEFQDELADIANAEHDVGLRLHRAHKRRERDAIEEPTTFWIRRVTS
jgi:hypothetical protein